MFLFLIKLALYCIGSMLLFRKTYAAVWHDLYGSEQSSNHAEYRD